MFWWCGLALRWVCIHTNIRHMERRTSDRRSTQSQYSKKYFMLLTVLSNTHISRIHWTRARECEIEWSIALTHRNWNFIIYTVSVCFIPIFLLLLLLLLFDFVVTVYHCRLRCSCCCCYLISEYSNAIETRAAPAPNAFIFIKFHFPVAVASILELGNT